MAEISPAYIAGFLDGEGNISILERNRNTEYSSYGLHIGFTNSKLEPLLLIKDIYGGNLFEKKRYSLRHSRSFELRISKRLEVARLLNDALPYLIIKKSQAELGLKFLALGKVKMEVVGRRKIHSEKGGSCPIVRAAFGEQDKRALIKSQLMELNTRGQRAS